MNLLIFNALSWEQRKLGDISDSYSGGTPTAGKAEYYGGKIPFIRSAEVNSDTTELFLTEEGLKNSSAKMVNKGDILYALYGATSGEVGLARLDGAINQAILDIKPHENFDASFIMQWLRKSKESIIGTYLQGGQGNLSGTIVTSLMVDCPNYAEQQKIGGFFSDLDNLITLHQSKAESWKNKENQLSTISWEQRKLGELGKARSGIGFPDAEQGGKEGVPFYKVSDMNNVGNEHEMVAANNHVTREQIARKGWKPIDEVPAIFFAKVGAAVLLNRKRLCRFPFLLDNNTMAYSIDGSALDADFAITLFDTIDLTSLVQVGALPSYNSGDVENIDAVIPEMSEQRKIGAYFKRIDSLITLHHRKLNRTQICINRSFLYGSF